MLGTIEKEQQLDNPQSNPTVNVVFRRNRNSDRRRYNIPTSKEIAMVFQNFDGEPPFERDFRVYPYPGKENIQLNILSPNLDPMTYPIFYPYGQPGWQPKLEFVENTVQHKISLLQYKIAQLAIRPNQFNPILNGGRLFQQWVVDSYLQVEANNLNFIRNNQKTLKVENYKGLHDYLFNLEEKENVKIGKTIVLPSSFQGSPRNMKEKYSDAMALVSTFGKPDLFITFTTNPHWKEIEENLYEGQNYSDRPDLVARVFNLKLKELMTDLMKREIFGKTIAHCYAIEFQKRGLPHAHVLIILTQECKIHPDDYDNIVCAEIPDINTEPELYEIVSNCMIHGPCGKDTNATCMEDGICSKDFPKNFVCETQVSLSGYPQYRRRNDGRFVMRKGKSLDNRNVIPYNKHLSKKYKCHVNVEICASFKSIKYLFKYVYKGYDCIELGVRKDGENHEYNEIKDFMDARYVSAPEAMWRLLEYKLSDISHAVIRLPVHLENEENIYFEEGHEKEAYTRAEKIDTMLTAWFKLNKEDENAQNYLYTEIPSHYTFNKQTGRWSPRKQGKIISRLYSVNVNDIERYYLRLVLLHVKGAKSFEDLRTYNGILYDTFKETAAAMRLLLDDKEWYRCLEEANHSKMPCQLRQMFAWMCIFNNVANPLELYLSFQQPLCEDYLFHNDMVESESLCLRDIENILKLHGISCDKLGLPEPKSAYNTSMQILNREELKKKQLSW